MRKWLHVIAIHLNIVQYQSCRYPYRTYFGGDFNLTFYNETYGSNATFHPADPTSLYWQNKIASTVQQLVDVWNVTGVYIDQLGAANQDGDWASNSNHTTGGGSWWTSGINDMIQLTKDSVPSQTPLVTESNAEPYMASLQGCVSVDACRLIYSLFSFRIILLAAI